MNEVERTAREWKAMGIATLPIGWKSKVPEVRSWSVYTERMPSEEELAGWYITPYHNLGIITGWQGLRILDFDDREKYYEWVDWAEHESTIARSVCLMTRIVLSGRGVHVYFYTRQPAENMKLDRVDVLCNRKYALMPPSIHPSGTPYQALQDCPPVRIERVEQMLPREWIISSQQAVSSGQQSSVHNEQCTVHNNEWGPDTVARIKRRFRMEDFFPGAQVGQSGWAKVRCPLHEDHSPSAAFHADKQIFVCFNECYGKKPLDVIGLYARMHHLTNSDAIKALAAMM